MSRFPRWLPGGRASVLRASRQRLLRDKLHFVSKKTRMPLRPLVAAVAAVACISSASAAPTSPAPQPAQANATAQSIQDFPDRVVVSVKDQKLMLVQSNHRVALFPI